MKSGALVIEELPDNSCKKMIDGEAFNIGLKSKYKAECVRKFLWKSMLFIEPVSFAVRFLLQYFTYVYIPCMAQFVVNGSVFTWYVRYMDNMSLPMCMYCVWYNLLSMGRYLHNTYSTWTMLVLDKCINVKIIMYFAYF